MSDLKKRVTVLAVVFAIAIVAMFLVPAARAQESVVVQWNQHIVNTWTCEDKLTGQRTPRYYSPWKPHNTSFREAQRDIWKGRYVRCSKALQEKKRQWNWQVFPKWIIDLANCESSVNWFAEGSSEDGLFYSAFNMGRARYDVAAHHMGMRGWKEGKGVPSPYEQAMTVIGYARIYGDGFAGNCHGIVRRSWT